jgi:hypothetical protein
MCNINYSNLIFNNVGISIDLLVDRFLDINKLREDLENEISGKSFVPKVIFSGGQSTGHYTALAAIRMNENIILLYFD